MDRTELGLLIIIFLLVAWLLSDVARAADTITVPAVCVGTERPCLRWSFRIESGATLTPTLVITGRDFDNPKEGTLTVSGHALDLFGMYAQPSYHLQTRTFGYPTTPDWWPVGNVIAEIRWTTDQENDPLKHEVTSMALQYVPADEWIGPVVCLRRGVPDRILYGFRNTKTGVRTAFAIEFTPAMRAQVDDMKTRFETGRGGGPSSFAGARRLAITSQEIALLWSDNPVACAGP